METIRWLSLIVILGLLGLTLLGLSIKIVRQYERGVVLRFGRLIRTRSPGFNLIIPTQRDPFGDGQGWMDTVIKVEKV